MNRARRCCLAVGLAIGLTQSFAVAGRAASLVSLYSFCAQIKDSACLDGETPWSRLLQVGAAFYGTTSAVTPTDAGIVFRLSLSGKFQSLHTFCLLSSCAEGAAPGKYLARGPDGQIYGVTTEGGVRNGGTVFEMSTTGELKTIYRFCSEANCLDGATPVAVTFDRAGDMFGTSTAGGRFREGTIFEITRSGLYRKLYDFCSRTNCEDGLSAGVLLPASDGNFYGTTAAGGANQAGTVFVVTPKGDLRTLYAFCAEAHCADGEAPNPVLVEDRDGNLRGTTGLAGAGDAGTIFQLTPSGSLKSLYGFCSRRYCDDGGDPVDGLVAAADGSFYGTAAAAGIYYNGVLFNISADGKYSVLYDFCATGGCFDGALPSAAPTLASDGNLYGATLAGGDTFNVGTIYKLIR